MIEGKQVYEYQLKLSEMMYNTQKRQNQFKKIEQDLMKDQFYFTRK